MNIRIKFRKYGAMKFISHLDVMRYFQKAMRRAGIDICFSEGFSPHMIMSFAAPLGVGLTSGGEYVDIRVNHAPPSAEAVRRLNETMAEGMDVVSFRLLPENSKNAMSIVAFHEFLKQTEIRIRKETKRGSQEVDIRPWVLAYSVEDRSVSLLLRAGSVHNLKPELLMQAFCAWAGTELPASALQVHRKELYAEQGDGDSRNLVSLEELGEDIG